MSIWHLQFPPTPVCIFLGGVEHALCVAVDRLQGRNARELDGDANLGCACHNSAAVSTDGIWRSLAGTVLTKCAIASRNDASFGPSGRTIGSANLLAQDTTRLRYKTENRDLRSVGPIRSGLPPDP
jgi:hypothetical protein